MIPVDQTKLHIPGKQNGNCVAAAIASILEMDIKDVPEFEDMPEHGKGQRGEQSWFSALLNWLKAIGFHLVRWDEEIYLPGYFIGNGPSKRGVEHSVIYKGAEIVHDPHPSRDGLVKMTSAWAFLPLDPAVLMLTNYQQRDLSLKKPEM